MTPDADVALEGTEGSAFLEVVTFPFAMGDCWIVAGGKKGGRATLCIHHFLTCHVPRQCTLMDPTFLCPGCNKIFSKARYRRSHLTQTNNAACIVAQNTIFTLEGELHPPPLPQPAPEVPIHPAPLPTRHNPNTHMSRFSPFTYFLLSSKRPNTCSNHDMALSYLILSFHTSKSHHQDEESR